MFNLHILHNRQRLLVQAKGRKLYHVSALKLVFLAEVLLVPIFSSSQDEEILVRLESIVVGQ